MSQRLWDNEWAKKSGPVKIKLTPLWLGGRLAFLVGNFYAPQPCKYLEPPPAGALASIGLANLTNPTKAVVPSDELIEAYLKAYLSATPRGQPTIIRQLRTSQPLPHTFAHKSLRPSAFLCVVDFFLQFLIPGASSSFTCARLRYSNQPSYAHSFADTRLLLTYLLPPQSNIDRERIAIYDLLDIQTRWQTSWAERYSRSSTKTLLLTRDTR
jgi:hypothetical protein